MLPHNQKSVHANAAGGATTRVRAAIYARVSTRDKGQDTGNQLHQLRDYADSRGWVLEAEYVDQETGTTANRPQFQAMMEDARRHEFDVVLFWALDRLSRMGVYPTITILRELDSWAVHWVSFTQRYLDSTGMFKDAIIAILAALAEQEAVQLRERTMAGLERARRQGKRFGRPPKSIDQGALEKLVDAGCSIREIARVLGIAHGTAHKAVKRLRVENSESGGGEDSLPA